MTFSKVEYSIYFFLLAFGFLLFQQQDLHHTVGSSYAYLNGHFTDFYDYNKTVVGGNDYLPFMYLIFALWNIPLSIFGLLTENLSGEGWRHLALYEIFWNKLLLAILFFVAANVIFKIGKLLANEDIELAKRAKYNFSLNPIAVFAVFLFGQYDILGLIISLVGYYFYLKKDFFKFVLFFSISISLKYYSFIIFFPLLIAVHKNIFKILFYSLMSRSLVLLQALFYWNNSAFRESFFALPLSKLSSGSGAEGLNIFSMQYMMILIYLILCLLVYFKKNIPWEKLKEASVFICLASYFLTFSAINWHPQWLIIITPFIALSTIYIRSINIYYLIQIISSICFFILVAHGWPGNVDNALLYGGILRSDLAVMYLRSSDLLPVNFLPFSGSEVGQLFYLGLGAPFIMMALDKGLQKFQRKTVLFDLNIRPNMLLKLNFLMGCLIVIVPSLACAFMPRDLAFKYFPATYDRSLVLGLDLGPGVPLTPVGEIYGSNILRQTFISEKNNLARIDFIIGTYARKNNSKLQIRLIKNNGDIIFSRIIDNSEMFDNEWFRVNFQPIKDSIGQHFVLQLSSPDALPGNGITLWSTAQDAYGDGRLTYGGAQLQGDINMKLFYER